ncbi:general transcription factor 3C polypeptide 1-like [Ctenocephalides felis]|uniref:general transcription factor 3C polypeptide 1-like n=1 Tax=Ctenocephalides felis TaxID=7515 RepID=UPI000E6E35AA|nr:general transcription factor 3C polypeptide 1-like [Ctenocephalides felis]
MGQQIIMEKISYKAILQESLKAKEPEEAILADIGYMPGDRRGAAGVDSSMFSHLKRNWHWTSVSYGGHQNFKKEDVHSVRDAQLKSVQKSVSLKDLPCHKKITAATLQIGTGMLVKSKKRAAVKKSSSVPFIKRIVKKDIVREIAPRRQRRKPANYDEIDKQALQRMSKLRVDWHPDEDRLLLLCKVGLMYLFPNWRSVTISVYIVRDILHKVTHSYNKTSKACQRRILYIMKNPQTESSVRLCLEEIRWIPEISKNFGTDYIKMFREKSVNHDEYANKVNVHYVELVTALRRIFGGFSVNSGPFSGRLPRTIHEFLENYNIRFSEMQTLLHLHYITSEVS